METRLEKLVEEKVTDVRGLMIEEQKSRQTGDSYTKEVTNEICHIYNDIEQAKNYRLQKSEKLQEVVSSKLEEIQVAIEAEKKVREESTHTVLELFGQMGTKLQTEIDAVKRERKESTDRLVQLMEVVLPHLEQARLQRLQVMNDRREEQANTAKLAKELNESMSSTKSGSRKTNRFSMIDGGLEKETKIDVAKMRASLPRKQTMQTSSQITIDTLKKSLPVLQGCELLEGFQFNPTDEEQNKPRTRSKLKLEEEENEGYAK